MGPDYRKRAPGWAKGGGPGPEAARTGVDLVAGPARLAVSFLSDN